jgi:flavin-binding protein dodecin
VVEAAGSSARSWDAAVTDAVRGASEDAADPIGVEVIRLWADLDGRKRLRTYRAAVKVSYSQAMTPPKADGPERRTAPGGRGPARDGSRARQERGARRA